MFNGIKRDVFVCRDTYDDGVYVFPASVGIRKFHGCIEWGAAWEEEYADKELYKRTDSYTEAEWLDESECKKIFGFFPKEGTAYLVEHLKTKTKVTEVDIDFSNKRQD